MEHLKLSLLTQTSDQRLELGLNPYNKARSKPSSYAQQKGLYTTQETLPEYTRPAKARGYLLPRSRSTATSPWGIEPAFKRQSPRWCRKILQELQLLPCQPRAHTYHFFALLYLHICPSHCISGLYIHMMKETAQQHSIGYCPGFKSQESR